MPNLKQHPDGDLYTDNFSVKELRCRCPRCNLMMPHKIPEDKLKLLQLLRIEVDEPLFIYFENSAYRCIRHPIEAKKIMNGGEAGEHNRGAFDIHCVDSVLRMKIIRAAVLLGATGLCVYETFIHIDWGHSKPVMWVPS